MKCVGRHAKNKLFMWYWSAFNIDLEIKKEVKISYQFYYSSSFDVKCYVNYYLSHDTFFLFILIENNNYVQ